MLHSTGLRTYDIILKVDGKPVHGLPAEDVTNLLRGDPYTTLTLVLGKYPQESQSLTHKLGVDDGSKTVVSLSSLENDSPGAQSSDPLHAGIFPFIIDGYICSFTSGLSGQWALTRMPLQMPRCSKLSLRDVFVSAGIDWQSSITHALREYEKSKVVASQPRQTCLHM